MSTTKMFFTSMFSSGKSPSSRSVGARKLASGCASMSRLMNTIPRKTSHFTGMRPRSLLFRSEEHTSELQSLMRISYAVFCLKKKKNDDIHDTEQDFSQEY